MNLISSTYEQALAYLTINSSFLRDLGLFHGRMGIVLFFAHYARISNSKHYEDFAGHLLDEIYEEINLDLPVNLENGLCGIGWGIEYLVQHGFMEGNTDEILADIDRKVMEIDPLRLSDLSFRRGLAGIAFYVIARLNAKRQTSILPFDTAYLKALKKALKYAKFSDNDEVPTNLLIAITKQSTNINITIPELLINKQTLDYNILGLENGLSGHLLYKIHNSIPHIFSFENTEKTNNIILFEEESRASKYGVGTYMSNIYNWLSTMPQVNVYIVYLRAKSTYIKSEQKSNINYIYIPSPCLPENIVDWQKQIQLYYKSIVPIIKSYIPTVSIFHLNYMHMEILACELKKYFSSSKIILTVHYTSWSFELLGNRNILQAIIDGKYTKNNKFIFDNILSEKRLLYLCDHIIAIAKHSYDDLHNIYNVPYSKLHLIPHGIFDEYDNISTQPRSYYRKKYGIKENDIVLIFAGRIDIVKGIKILSHTISLLKNYTQLHFIIAGSGDYNTIFTENKENWINVSFTGLINRKTLYELFYLSDIGIIPSIHEEFGYVALEMMMMGLPIIGSNTTGLSEIIKNEKTGILITLSEQNTKMSSILLKNTIIKLSKNLRKRKALSISSRNHFKQYYTFKSFKSNMDKLLQIINL